LRIGIGRERALPIFFNRFHLHPFYVYKFYGIYSEDDILKTIFVSRIIEINNRKVLRIVDVLGKLEGLKSIKNELLKLLKSESAEYVDLMNYGIHPDVVIQLGFEQLDIKGRIVIPNYFEPFLQQNILIHCGYKSPYPYVMFKADADQDRPNLID